MKRETCPSCLGTGGIGHCNKCGAAGSRAVRGTGQRVACYDNGGATCDRFTVVYLDQPERAANTFAAVGMNHEPFHPQGFGQHTAAMPGRHLGRRIAFAALPGDCQKLVKQDLAPIGC